MNKLIPYYQTDLGKLYLSDCLDVLPLIDSKVDMILTDPPYSITQNKWDSVIDLDLMWVQLKRIIKKNGAIVLTASQPFTTVLISSNMNMFKYCWVWSKKMASGFLNAKKQPLKAHEDVLIFSKNTITYNPQMIKRTDEELKRLSKKSVKTSTTKNYGYIETTWSRNRTDNKYKHPNTIINIIGIMNRSNEKVLHPTQKPVALMEYLIRTYTNENELVLDFCIGSGTTAIACEKLNRQWIGIEKEKEYCDIAVNRIEKERKQRQLFAA